MKKFQSLEEFDQQLKNEEIPNFNTNLIYNKINNKGSVFMFKFKKVALVTCISVVTCTSLVFAATKLNNALYNNNGEKILQVSSKDTFYKENPDAANISQIKNQLSIKLTSQSSLIDSQLKDGEMVVKLYRDKESGIALLDYYIKATNTSEVAYEYDSKYVYCTSFDELKTTVGDWAKFPKYLPADSQFSKAKIRYSLDLELISQLRKEMIAELETKTEDFTYRIIKIPTKSILRNIQITFTSEKYGPFSIYLSHGSLNIQADNDGLVNKIILENNKEAIIDKNKGIVYYADESQMKESAQIITLNNFNIPSTAELNTSKDPLIYSIYKLSVKSLDEVKKILESIE